MPVTKSAKKALRRDHRRAKINKRIRQRLKKTLAKARKTKTQKGLVQAYRVLDRATKKGVLHKNKAARLKSRLAKTVSQETKETEKKSQKKSG